MVSGETQEWAMVLYNVPDAPLLWHQRLILGELVSMDGTDHSHVYAVYTPDGDVYLEDFSGRLQGITAVRFAATRRTLPGGIPPAATYRFPAAVGAEDLANAKLLAADAAEEWWNAQGGPRPSTLLRPVGVADPAAGGQQQPGQQPAATQQPGQQQADASAANVAPAETDARTLAINLRGDGSRELLAWREVASKVEEVAAPDWPLNGPRTTDWVCRFIDRRGGGGPIAYHPWWQQARFLRSDDYQVKVHDLVCRTLELAGTYDSLDITNLACFEYLARAVQRIEHDYRDTEDGHHAGSRGQPVGGGTGTGSMYDQEAVFSGLSQDKGQIMCCPALLEDLAGELSVATNVQKQLRKADEEREFAKQKNKKGQTAAAKAAAKEEGK